jgi:hypothetical protein
MSPQVHAPPIISLGQKIMKTEKFSPPFEEYNLGFIWLLHLDMKKKERFACFRETKYFHLKINKMLKGV